jgi:hypothetical protein
MNTAISRMWLYYSGPDAATERTVLVFRCLLWWVMGCILLFMVYGGLLLFYLEQKPDLVASTVPGLLSVVHEVVVRWYWQCITVLSWVMPLFCLWMTLVHFMPGKTANADRTRIPFNPRH